MFAKWNRPAALILWISFARTPATPVEPNPTTSVAELLGRLCESFPAGKYIPPQRFLGNAAVQRLLRLAEADLGALLREYQFDAVIPTYGLRAPTPLSYERFKQAPRPWRIGKDGKRTLEESDRSRKAYETYLAEWRKRQQLRGQLTHKRELISKIVAELGRRRPVLMVRLLEHEDLRVQIYAIRLLNAHDGLSHDQIVRACLRKLPPKLPGRECLHRSITMEDDIESGLAWALSRWRVREALPYLRKLGKHPRHTIRRTSLHLMMRYGFQEAIPHAIALLQDEVYVIRTKAFTNLVTLTALDFGQTRELWGERSAEKERAAAAEAWRSWWTGHRRRDDDAAFHAEVIERALRLMDLAIQGRRLEGVLGDPQWVLRQHLDVSPLGRLSLDRAERAGQLKSFWRERRADLRFDPAIQRFVLKNPRNAASKDERDKTRTTPRGRAPTE